MFSIYHLESVDKVSRVAALHGCIMCQRKWNGSTERIVVCNYIECNIAEEEKNFCFWFLLQYCLIVGELSMCMCDVEMMIVNCGSFVLVLRQ